MSKLCTEEELKDACQKIVEILQGERDAEEEIPPSHVIDVLGFTLGAYLLLCDLEKRKLIFRVFTETVREFTEIPKED